MNPHQPVAARGLTTNDVAALAWRDAWRLQARNHPWMTGGLGLALLAVAWLLASGIRQGLSGGGEPLRLAVLGGLAGFGATAVGALAGDTSTSGPQYQMAQQNRWVLTEIRDSQRDGSGALAVVMTLQRRSVSLPCGRTEREDQFDNITSAGDNEAVGSARNCASMPCDPNASSPDTKQTKLNIYQVGTGNDQPIATIILRPVLGKMSGARIGIDHYPLFVQAMVRRGSAAYLLIEQDFKAKYPAATKEYVDSFTTAGTYIDTHRRDAIRIARQYMNIDEKVFEQSLNHDVSYSDLRLKRGEVEKLQKYSLELGLLKKPVNLDTLLDTSLVKASPMKGAK